MEPMILAGSIVLIDTRKRAIAKRKDWVNEFDRPIYFFLREALISADFASWTRTRST